MNKDEKTREENEPTPAKAEPEGQRILLSATDAYVADRLKSQPNELSGVDIRVEDKKDPTKHRLSLPDEIVAFEKKYTFKWLMKNKQNLDYACDVRGWVLVNRTYFPGLPRHLFSVNGSIERGDAILAFIKKEIADHMRREPSDKSHDRVQGTLGKHRDDPRYYSPDSGTKDQEGKEVVQI